MSDIILENKNIRLTLTDNAIVKSLIYKQTNEELLLLNEEISLFSLTQARPFKNEIKLSHMNKKTAFQANKIVMDGNVLTVSFEIVPCQASITVDIQDEYISFTLKELLYPNKEHVFLSMDMPPVEEFRLLQLPIKTRKNFGQWLNVMWDDSTSIAVVAATPETMIDSEKRNGGRILTADLQKSVQLEGTTATLIVSGGKEAFLDAMDKFEHEYNLPLGVESRRSDMINRSVYWVDRLTPENVEEHIKFAKMGGFSCMLIYYEGICSEVNDDVIYGSCGDYSISKPYSNSYEQLKVVVDKIKAAGITPGFHFLHTHIGKETKYVTPTVDPRLNIIEYFTLTQPLGMDDDKIYVAQNPKNALKRDKRRVLKFGEELMSYEGFSTVPPYHFYGVKRGYWDTTVTSHATGIIGGILDVSEYCANSVYVDQNTDLQDEIAEEIAKIYDLGFEFIYFDGSEGTNKPYEYHVPNAQYRVIKKLGSAPKFCEGAAKAHFNWHFLSGANAFDIFKTNVFKRMIDVHPLAESDWMCQDFTRLNFGWWAFYEDTRRDIYEYGTSHAHGWNSPATIQSNLKLFNSHARTADILEVMRRWEDVRKNNLLTSEQQELIKVPGKEYTLFIDEAGKYELQEYFELENFCSNSQELYAFTLQRGNRSYALLWHNTGSAKISIPIQKDNAEYFSDLTREKLPMEEKDGYLVVDVSSSAYLSTTLSQSELRDALSRAKPV